MNADATDTRDAAGRRGWRGQRGAAAVEVVVLVPALMLIVALVAGGGRVWFARSTLAQIADSAARAASLARDPATAQADARAVAALDLAAAELRCAGGPSVSVDTSGFGVPVGQSATVGVQVECAVSLSDLVLPGLPGSLTVVGASRSTLDRYRGRG